MHGLDVDTPFLACCSPPAATSCCAYVLAWLSTTNQRAPFCALRRTHPSPSPGTTRPAQGHLHALDSMAMQVLRQRMCTHPWGVHTIGMPSGGNLHALGHIPPHPEGQARHAGVCSPEHSGAHAASDAPGAGGWPTAGGGGADRDGGGHGQAAGSQG